MKRVPTAELLDKDAGTAGEISASLKDLDHINRWFGGIRTSQNLIAQVAREAGISRMSVLEVAAGSGNTAVAVADKLSGKGLPVNLALLDRAVSHLANGMNNGMKDGSRGRTFVNGDALNLPFRENAFDVVSCNLFLHHLSPPEAKHFVQNALRVSRHAVVINDVSRSWVHLGFVYLGMPLFRSRITRNDAPASVRQAYTTVEIKSLLSQSSAEKVEIKSRFLFRIAAIAWKKRVAGS